MAITQQIVRLTPEQLKQAQADVAGVDLLISFDLASAEDTLDLDWAPSELEKLAQVAWPADQVQALKLLFDGTALIHPEFTNGTDDYTVYSDITYLPVEEVLRISQLLSDPDLTKISVLLNQSEAELKAFLNIRELARDPADYYLGYLKQLLAFLHEAAERKLALAMWWD